MNQRTNQYKPKLWLLLWLILLGLALTWRAQNLDAFGLSNDEGAHVMWAQLAVDGFTLYEETVAVQSPLFLEAVALAFRLGGSSLLVGRWAILLSFILLAAALSWLAHRAGGWLAALAALFLLGISPLLFTFSRLVMAEVPATGLAVAALVLAFVYFDKNHRGWLVASGLMLGLSLITKALNPFVAVPIGLILLLRYFDSTPTPSPLQQWKNLLIDGLLWGGAVLLPIILLPLIYNPAALYEQLVAFRGDLRAAIPGCWPDTWAKFELFVFSHWGVWLLAVAGAVIAGWQSVTARTAPPASRNLFIFLHQNPAIFYALTWTLWLLAGVVMLLWHTPLFPHHFIVLLPPLILLAAGFIKEIVALSRRRHWAMALWLGVVAAALNLPTMITANQKTAAIVTGGRETEAIQLLEAVSAPTDFVMGDSQLLIFMADRRTPPPLGDVALVAIKAGRQTSDRMIQMTEDFGSPAVVQWSLRLPWLPEYLAWIDDHYLAKRIWDNDHIIYFAPRWFAGQPIPNEQDESLGPLIRLRGFQLDETSSPDGRLDLKLFWQADAPPEENYTVFTQLLDSCGAYVAGWDSQPLAGYFPTRQWPAGEIISDIVQFPLPPDLPPGEYTLITGMYLLNTGERLTQPDGSDHIVLSTLTIP